MIKVDVLASRLREIVSPDLYAEFIGRETAEDRRGRSEGPERSRGGSEEQSAETPARSIGASGRNEAPHGGAGRERAEGAEVGEGCRC